MSRHDRETLYRYAKGIGSAEHSYQSECVCRPAPSMDRIADEDR